MATLGEILRDQRERLGLSLEQAEETTKVRAKLLEMLENDDYEHLPNPGYVKGYVASYAKYLELDPFEMTELYRRQVGTLHEHRINLTNEPVVAPTSQEHAVPWQVVAAVVGVVIVVALLIWGIARIVNPPQASVPAPPQTSQPATSGTGGSQPATTAPETKPQTGSASGSTESTSGTGGASTTTGGSGSSSNQTGAFKLEVQVAQGGRSWLRITVDGQTAYEGVLAGGSKTYEVKKSASVRIGAPTDVTVLRDGTPVKIPSGSIPTVTLKAGQ